MCLFCLYFFALFVSKSTRQHIHIIHTWAKQQEKSSLPKGFFGCKGPRGKECCERMALKSNCHFRGGFVCVCVIGEGYSFCRGILSLFFWQNDGVQKVTRRHDSNRVKCMERRGSIFTFHWTGSKPASHEGKIDVI